jgi:hypothetical protein
MVAVISALIGGPRNIKAWSSESIAPICDGGNTQDRAISEMIGFAFGDAWAPSLIPRQLPPSPMLVFPRWAEHAVDVAVQRPHDTDARERR